MSLDDLYVFPALSGGIGNQLFQIAAAIGVSRQLQRKLGMSFSSFRASGQGNEPCVYRSSMYKKLPSMDMLPCLPVDEFQWCWHRIRIPPGRFNILLRGYWQSYKYWSHCQDEIMDIFDFSWFDQSRIDSLRDSRKQKLCAVHYRGGDYILRRDKHYVCQRPYYLRSLRALSCDYKLVLFTDDIRSALEEDIPFDVHCSLGSDVEEMAYMAFCDAAIISNSSYAWWGANLGRKKIEVHAPDRWFGPKGPSKTSSIYMNDWILHPTIP